MLDFAILLPPSNVQNKHGNKFAPDVFDYREKTTFNYFHQLIPERRHLIDAVHRAIEVEGEEVVAERLGTSDAVPLIQQAYTAELMAARQRYDPGPLYAALNFPRLPTGAQRRFLENSLIISGLFGLLRPDDLMPQYRLPIDADVPGIGNVSDYWRPLISPLINEAVAGCFVWDLLDEVHRSVWVDERTYRAYARVKFYGRQGQEITETESLRGLFVHHMVQKNKVGRISIETWQEQDAQGYRFDEYRSELSEEHHLVFAMSKR